MRYLDPVSLAQLRNLSLDLRRATAEGHLTGRHRSSARGPSHEFAQHRPYVPGDELRTLDWKVFARQERYYVREYESENILTSTVLLDASGSMGFASGGRPPKWEHACRLAMALSYLVLAEGDAVGLAAFDTEPREFLAPRAGFGQLEVLDARLGQTQPVGETDLPRVLELAAARLRRRSVVVLISDLLGDPQSVLKVVKALQARRHELMVLQVLDPGERDFVFEGPVVFRGLEDDGELFCDATSLRASYREAFRRQQRLYEAGFHGASVAYMPFFTDRPWAEDLAYFLGRRPA